MPVMPLLLASLVALWWMVSGGAAASWIIGLPAIAVAAWLVQGKPVARTWRFSAIGGLRFAAYFFYGSLRGGLDVALRVLARKPRVMPGMVRHSWCLPEAGPSRAVFVISMSLLPGTLVADFDAQGLCIHTLDTRVSMDEELQTLERLIRAMFVEHSRQMTRTGA